MLKATLDVLRRSLLGEEPQPELVPGDDQPSLQQQSNNRQQTHIQPPTLGNSEQLKLEQAHELRLSIFYDLINNMRWHSLRRRPGYNIPGFEKWKEKQYWKLLDENLSFLDLGKFIRSFIKQNNLNDVNLSAIKGGYITMWHENIYGESDDEEDELFSEVVEATEEELERLQLSDRLQPSNKGIQQQLQSTRLEPRNKTK